MVIEILSISCFVASVALLVWAASRPLIKRRAKPDPLISKAEAALKELQAQKIATLPQDEIANKVVEQSKKVGKISEKAVEKAVTSIENKTGRTIYQDDFDAKEIQDYLQQAASQIGLSEEEIESLSASMEGALGELPTRPPAVDDMCPECGKEFAMIDDYICQECRSKR